MFWIAFVLGAVAYALLKLGAMSVWVGVLTTSLKFTLIVCAFLLLIIVLLRFETQETKDE
jgi:hypothetical protein